jgi:peroxiredoxin Q/BCP
MNTIPSVGSKAPDFKLPDQNGDMHQLSLIPRSWVLLYFYPKDDTPGCTLEAQSLEELLPNFQGLDAKVFGISTDSIGSHKKFAEKYNLSFTLLADEDKKVVSLYGVWGNKKFMGKEYEGTMRTSFLINPEGKIEKIYENVKPEVHAAEVLADITKANSA